MLLTLLPVPFCIRYSKVFYASVNKLLSQLFLEDRILSVDVASFGHIISVLDLMFLCFQKSIKVILKSSFFFTSEDKKFSFWLCWSVRLLFLERLFKDIGLFFRMGFWRFSLFFLLLLLRLHIFFFLSSCPRLTILFDSYSFSLSFLFLFFLRYVLESYYLRLSWSASCAHCRFLNFSKLV